MNHQPVLFRTSAEAEAAHLTLDRTAALPFSERGSLEVIDEYQFASDDEVKCQLERDGYVCGELHGKGHVVKRADGVKGYLGGHCSKKHLGHVEQFRKQQTMVRRAIEVQARKDSLQAHLANEELPNRIAALHEQSNQMVSRGRVLRETFPRSLVSLLADRLKRGSTEVAIEVAHKVPAEGETTRNDWRRERVGNVAGLTFSNGVVIDLVRGRARALIKAYGEAREAINPQDRDVKRWLLELDNISKRETEVGLVERSMALFVSDENLEIVKYLANEANCLPEALIAMDAVRGKARLAYGKAIQDANEWLSRVRRAHGNREVRPAEERTIRPGSGAI